MIPNRAQLISSRAKQTAFFLRAIFARRSAAPRDLGSSFSAPITGGTIVNRAAFASTVLLCAVVALVPWFVNAQAPDAVPVAKEPHHHLVLENSYVRVFRVTVPAHSATLLHQHDLPYLYVAIGPGDFTNAVAGKPEVHVMMQDGQAGYSAGHFAHVARVDADIPFNNVTVELLRPQGEVRNLCQKVVEGPVRDCSSDKSSLPANSPLLALANAMRLVDLFETDEILVRSFSVSLKQTYSDAGPQLPRLLIVGGGSELQLDLPGEPSKTLHGGETAWIDAGRKAAILTPGPSKVTRFVIGYFKEKGPGDAQ